MTEERVKRRLAAILAADVAGYARLINLDEAGTLAALKQRWREVLQPLVAAHQGRIFKTMGDGVLVEFASAVNAIACAAELQKGMRAANKGVKEDRSINFRVGVNVGDVVVEGGDLHGDGVIIAVRLQGMADPGGICVSRSVYDQVANKLNLLFEDLGLCEVKNIASPVHVFRVANMEATPQGDAENETIIKPSIAVLPFTNLGGDPAQQYFSDGITEDIITELARFRSLFVIASHSSFQYRDKSVDVRRVGHELRVQYVVEGSLRKSGNRLRMTAQLINARTGNHVWSERYDRGEGDVIAVQDEIVQAIVATIAGQVVFVELDKARHKRTEHLGAYDCFLHGLHHWRGVGNKEGDKSSQWLEKALELDPGYAEALARLSINKAQDGLSDQALLMANKAVTLDPNNGWCHCALGFAKLVSGSVLASESHFKTALRLNANDPDLMMWCVMYYQYSGQFDEAERVTKICEKLNPLPPAWYRNVRAVTEYNLRRYASAAQLLESQGTDKMYWSHYYLAACYQRLDNTQEAKRQVAMALKMRPALTIRDVAALEPYVRPDDMEHLLEPVRQAGLPN